MSGSVQSLAEGNNRFALELYHQIRGDEPTNLFFAPGSISTAMGMTYAGARGETEAEMGRVFHFTQSQEELHRAFAVLNRVFGTAEEKRGYQLAVANRLWGQEGCGFLPEFLKVTREDYGAELEQVDFAGQVEQARSRINTWVEQQTAGAIRDLIPSGALNSQNRLVVTNAIYFKGTWSEPFDEGRTEDAPFHVTPDERLDVPLMSHEGVFPYWAGEGLAALDLPYGSGDLSMLVLLPDGIEGLASLESQLNVANVTRWESSLRRATVQVDLPRFKLTSQFELASILRAMGMVRAFAPGQADFSGMDGRRDLFVSAVIHKAFVDVNEEGTEAAAATGMVMRASAAMLPRQPIVFRADHPFLFLIRDKGTGSILFIGRLVNPQT